MKDYAYLKINLQLFGEKTEPATPKRRQELRQKGQIPRSRELVTAVVLLISFFSMRFLSKFIFGDLIFAVRNSLSFPKDIDSRFTTNEIMLIFLQNLLIFAKILAPILLIIALGKPVEKVVIEDIKNDDVKYWRDENKTHHVPKRTIDELILKL